MNSERIEKSADSENCIEGNIFLALPHWNLAKGMESQHFIRSKSNMRKQIKSDQRKICSHWLSNAMPNFIRPCKFAIDECRKFVGFEGGC